MTDKFILLYLFVERVNKEIAKVFNPIYFRYFKQFHGNISMIIKLDTQIDHLAIELYFHYFMISGAQRKLNGRESEGRLRKKGDTTNLRTKLERMCSAVSDCSS